MKSSRKCLIALLVAACQFLLLATLSTAASEGKKIATVNIPVKADLYATAPQPLTTAQCGQCHPSYFNNLKNDGGKHRFDCQQCHKAFHNYNPTKGGYDAIMPKCASCHDLPHGTGIKDCASCHANPHTPKKVAMTQRLTNACAECHAGPKEQLTKFPSKHTKLACAKCHTSHGYIPQCSACHKPHYQGQEFSTCTKCHAVHKPLQVTYEKTEPAISCGACHKKIYEKWQKTPSKHAKVNCATCHHTRHKLIPKCTECHAQPHKKSFLEKFPKCLSCHLDVHDLPVKKK